jgi:hypothetical protein
MMTGAQAWHKTTISNGYYREFAIASSKLMTPPQFGFVTISCLLRRKRALAGARCLL